MRTCTYTMKVYRLWLSVHSRNQTTEMFLFKISNVFYLVKLLFHKLGFSVSTTH